MFVLIGFGLDMCVLEGFEVDVYVLCALECFEIDVSVLEGSKLNFNTWKSSAKGTCT